MASFPPPVIAPPQPFLPRLPDPVKPALSPAAMAAILEATPEVDIAPEPVEEPREVRRSEV